MSRSVTTYDSCIAAAIMDHGKLIGRCPHRGPPVRPIGPPSVKTYGHVFGLRDSIAARSCLSLTRSLQSSDRTNVSMSACVALAINLLFRPWTSSAMSPDRMSPAA